MEANAPPPVNDRLLRARLARLIGGYRPNPFKIVGNSAVAAVEGVRIEELAIESAGGFSLRGFLAGPAGAWRGRAGILHCHAHGNRYEIGAAELVEGRPAFTQPSHAVAFARAGFVVLSIDLAGFGSRADETEAALAKAHLWRGTTLFGQMLCDLGGALGLLGGLPGVDARRLGAFGLSMGATQAFWLAALDRRVAAVAHLCCFADLETLVESGAHDLHGLYMSVPGLLSVARTGQIAGLVAPRPQLVAVGLADPLTPEAAWTRGLADLTAAYAAKGAADRLEPHVDPASGHVETPEFRARVLDFFGRRL